MWSSQEQSNIYLPATSAQDDTSHYSEQQDNKWNIEKQLRINKIQTFFDFNYSKLKARGKEYDNNMPTLLMAYVQSRDCTSSSMLMTGIPITLMANYLPTLTMSNPGGGWRPSSTTLYIKEHARLSLLNKSRLFSWQCSSSRHHKKCSTL